MAQTSSGQRKTIGRVMHEFKHGELKSGPAGKAGKVRNPRQAIAIALHEGGASKSESPKKNRSNLAKSKRKESSGETAQQESEGKSHLGASTRKRSAARGRKKNAPKREKTPRRTRHTAR